MATARKSKAGAAAGADLAVDAGLYGLSAARADKMIDRHIRAIAAELLGSADPLLGGGGGGGATGLAGKSASNATIAEHVALLRQLARIYGLDSRQAHACVRMALGLSVRGVLAPLPATASGSASRGDDAEADEEDRDNDAVIKQGLPVPPALPGAAQGAALLKLVYPRPGATYGRELVLDVIGALGPAPGALEDPRAAKEIKDARRKRAMSAGEEDDEEEEQATADKKKKKSKSLRRHVHLRVQAMALKLIVLLLDTPSISIDVAGPQAAPTVDAEGQPGSGEAAASAAALRAAHRDLPSTFLDSAAKKLLDRCYGVLFHFLEYQTLRPYLCYLLCKIARRKHVKSYRVANLLAMRSMFPDEPAIFSLLAVFGNFYPDLLFPDLVNGGGASGATSAGMNLGLLSGGGIPPPGLKYPDLPWLVAVIDLHRYPLGLPAPTPQQDAAQEDEAGGDADEERAAKRRKLAAARAGMLGVADALTGSSSGNGGLGRSSYVIPNGAVISVSSSSLIVSELPSIRSLGMALDRLQLPSQMASALNNRLVRLALLVDDDPEVFQCIAEWLISALEDEMHAPSPAASSGLASATAPGTAMAARVSLLVERTHELFALAGELPPALTRWLYALLANAAHALSKGEPIAARRFLDSCPLEAILPLVELVKPDTEEAIAKSLLQPLVAISQSPYTPFGCKVQTIVSLTAMLQLWARFDWARGLRQQSQQTRTMKMRYGITPLRNCELCFESIDRTAAVLVSLASKLLNAHPRSIRVQAATLDVYSTLSGSLSGLQSSVLPALPMTMLLILAPTIYSASRFFGLTQALRRNFEAWEFAQDEAFEQQQLQSQQGGAGGDANAPANSREGRIKQAELAYFDEPNRESLNRMVVVLADVVWRVKGFATVEEENGTTIGLGKRFFTNFKQRCEERGESALMTGSLTQGLAFVSLAEQFMHSMAREAGWSGPALVAPISQASLKAARTRRGFPASVVWTEYRARFLHWLEAKGAGGLQELLSAIMSSLRPSAAQRQPARPQGSQASQLQQQPGAPLSSQPMPASSQMV